MLHLLLRRWRPAAATSVTTYRPLSVTCETWPYWRINSRLVAKAAPATDERSSKGGTKISRREEKKKAKEQEQYQERLGRRAKQRVKRHGSSVENGDDAATALGAARGGE